MVLVHKLKRMGGMNAEETRDAEEHGTMDEDNALEEQSTADDSAHPEGQSKRAASPPHRPLTRSQTGHAPKRRRRHLSPSPQPQPPTKTRKRASSTAAGSSLAQTSRRSRSVVRPDDAKSVEGSASDTLTSASHSQRTESDDATAVGDAPSSAPTKLTFVETSSSAIGSLYERRGPRARAALPVPVPNLTKKSRGRRVPTKLADEDEEKGDQKGKRIYVCQVENCGKCFHRGEHLKRHIRSIHTHEKPFKCTHPACDKRFNRHDNLLQHLRVHKQNKTKSKSVDASHSDPEDGPPSPHQDQAPRQDASPMPSHSQSHHDPDAHQHTPRAAHVQASPVVYPQPPHQPYSGTSLHNTRVAFYHQTSYAHPSSSFFSFPASYDASSSPSFATNMAVSSLRTEIPASPQVSRI